MTLGSPPTHRAPSPWHVPPPHILALTRDFSSSPEGSNASQVSCAELVPSSSMKPRAQRAFLPQQPILRLVAGFPSARVTSAGPGEEVKGVKGEEGRWPGWGLRADQRTLPASGLVLRTGSLGSCVPTQHLRPGRWLVLRLFLAHPVTPVMRVAASWTAQHEWLGRGRRGAPAETWPGGACHSSLTSMLLLPRAGLGWAADWLLSALLVTVHFRNCF